MSAELVLQLAAMAWSLLFSYLPKLKDWFDALSAVNKLLLQLGVFAVVVYGAFAGSCLGLLTYFPCEDVWAGLLSATILYFKVVIANQGIYQVSRLVSGNTGEA